MGQSIMPTLGVGPSGQPGWRSASNARPVPLAHGFGPRVKFDIDRFRAEQTAPLAQLRPYLMGANILAILVILWFGSHDASDPWLIAWTFCQAALTTAVLRPWSKSHSFISNTRRTIGLIEATSLAFAVLWAFPPLQLFSDAPREIQHIVTAISFVASVTGAFALTRLPSASIAYTAVVSGAVFVSEMRHGEDIDLILGFSAVIIPFLMSLMSLALNRTLIRRAADT
jgi:hypothetical protein